jgi:hypothetical protein
VYRRRGTSYIVEREVVRDALLRVVLVDPELVVHEAVWNPLFLLSSETMSQQMI